MRVLIKKNAICLIHAWALIMEEQVVAMTDPSSTTDSMTDFAFRCEFRRFFSFSLFGEVARRIRKLISGFGKRNDLASHLKTSKDSERIV